MAPKDFRTFKIHPTLNELVHSKRIEPQPNIVKGSYNSIEHYLATQFWLLRDDFVSPLVKGVQEYIKWDNSTDKFVSPDIKLCCKINFETAARNDIKICLSTDERDKYDDLKALMKGSLVFFTCNNFKTVLFATIKGSASKNSQETLVDFCHRCEENIFANEYMMFEGRAFFGRYNHVLKALQEMSCKDEFPFPRYFIRASSEIHPPRYLRNGFKRILVKGISNQMFDCSLLYPKTWPSAAELGLDNLQLEAVQSALSSELALIRGPPGTGKTRVGLEVVKILIENKERLNRKAPILVVSNTKFAIDQFLIQSLKITAKLVRIGNTNEPELEAFNFNKYKGPMPSRLNLLAKQDIIGMTTTLAASMRSELKELACEVGDENQLQPQLENTDLEALKLNVSFFERMLLNNCKSSTLNVQYRMAPEMAKLITPFIYKDLTNGAHVLKLPKLLCFTKRVSFVAHNISELAENRDPSLSRKNPYEADFLVALSRYLLLHKVFAPSNITILSTYSDQVSLIKKLISNSKNSQGLNEIKVVTVDDYQGGENSVVLLSLVRSNHQGDIGFLSVKNRISVALSKAMHVLVIVGSMDTLSKNCRNWQRVKECLIQQDALDRCLTLRCPVHPEIQFTVKQSSEFGQKCVKCNATRAKPPAVQTPTTPDSSFWHILECGHTRFGNSQQRCLMQCGKRLACGHTCLKRCHFHSLDRHHRDVRCEQIVTAVRSCGHRVGMMCGEDVELIRCEKACTKVMNCGHRCQKKCYKRCEDICQQCRAISCCTII